MELYKYVYEILKDWDKYNRYWGIDAILDELMEKYEITTTRKTISKCFKILLKKDLIKKTFLWDEETCKVCGSGYFLKKGVRR